MQCIVLLETHRSARRMRVILDTYFIPSPIYQLYVKLLEISYQARFCLQISYPENSLKMLKAEMPTSPILSYLVRQTEQNTIILFCLSKYDFPPMSVFRSLSLFFLFISYQTITLVWHFISLLFSGETLPK